MPRRRTQHGPFQPHSAQAPHPAHPEHRHHGSPQGSPQTTELGKADEVTQAMRSGIVVAIDEEIAISAADLFIRHKLPLADSLIYAITLAYKATLWTQDQHFEGLPQVRYFPKIKA